MLLHKDRNELSLLIEIGELRPAAKNGLFFGEFIASTTLFSEDALSPVSLMLKWRWADESASKTRVYPMLPSAPESDPETVALLRSI